MDLKQICRTCLQTNKQRFDMFKSYYTEEKILYADMLCNYTKLMPREDDRLPRLICKDCVKQLKRVYLFNKQCVDSDEKLRSHIKSKEFTVVDVQNEHFSENKAEDVSSYNDYNDDKFLVSLLDERSEGSYKKEEIKIEPVAVDNNEDNGMCWESEDMLLKEVKSKEIPDSEPNADDNYEDAEICWGSEELLLNEVKSKHILDSDTRNGALKVKKKRGRRKKDEILISESKVPHQCDICGKFLSNRSNLKAHKICHTELRPYKCSDCPADFRGHSALFQHKKVHTGETPYHCDYCPKQFQRRTNLVNHIRIHTGEKMFSCSICCKNFVQSAQLSVHMKRHIGDKPYLCQDCGKGFPLKSDLTVHQRIHNGEKPYSCHLCTKTFATSGNLSIHVRIHNNEIRYKCKECNRGFVTCSSYNVHLKRHKGQRDYHCECGKSFFTSSALKQHKVVHTGEKKYQCKICDRKFTQTSHLTRHFKRDHAKPNVPMPASEHFRLVLNRESSSNKGSMDLFNDLEKVTQDVNHVKCEGT